MKPLKKYRVCFQQINQEAHIVEAKNGLESVLNAKKIWQTSNEVPTLLSVTIVKTTKEKGK